MTARIPLWPGAKVTVIEHGVSWSAHVLGGGSGDVFVAWAASDDKNHAGIGYFDADQVVPDFTDPDTFRGSIARLAEHLGNSAESISKGVLFSCHGKQWALLVGPEFDLDSNGFYIARGTFGDIEGATNRAEALTIAWAQVLAEVKPCP